MERTGLIDFTLGGHTCVRPAAVTQGHDGNDRFDVVPDESKPAAWKSNNVRLELVKFTNLGSFFSSSALLGSPALRIATWSPIITSMKDTFRFNHFWKSLGLAHQSLPC